VVKFIMEHPWALALALPALMAGVPAIVGKIEKAALARLLAAGDPADQEAIRATVKVWVLWAEKKHLLPGLGPVKFEKVDKLLASALPMLSAEQRSALIESVLKEVDDDAHAAVDAPAA
jgi:hypothetical protein